MATTISVMNIWRIPVDIRAHHARNCPLGARIRPSGARHAVNPSMEARTQHPCRVRSRTGRAHPLPRSPIAVDLLPTYHRLMELRLPTLDEENEFRRMVAAIPVDNPTFLHFHRAEMRLAEYLDVLRNQAAGIDPAAGREVPSTFLFAFVEGRIVGRVSIRHSLD